MFSILGAGLFITIWWTVIFAVLPFGVKSQSESGVVIAGSEPGAPEKFQMLRVVLITTVVAIVVWLGVFSVIELGLVDLDLWSKHLIG
jgi:predicted secreted protein